MKFFSELKSERQLDGSRAANLRERIDTTVYASGSQTGGQVLRRVPKQWAAQIVDGTAKVRVVEDVEELASEAKLYLVREVKLALKRDIGLRDSEAS